MTCNQSWINRAAAYKAEEGDLDNPAFLNAIQAILTRCVEAFVAAKGELGEGRMRAFEKFLALRCRAGGMFLLSDKHELRSIITNSEGELLCVKML